MNNIPIAVQQMIENALNDSNPEYVRFNNYNMLLNVKESCESAINKYDKKSKFKR